MTISSSHEKLETFFSKISITHLSAITPLDPPLERYRTISVDADLRILFRMVDPSTALFLKIGTHDELYGKGNQ